jgi:hypothetical protein
MGRKRTLNYRELRSYDDEGGEERKKDEDEVDDEEEEEDEDEEADEEADEETDEEADEEEDEPVVKAPKKKAAPKAPKAPKPKRTRAGKVVRLRVVWGVYNNSNQRVAVFDYAKKNEAEAHAAKLTEDKKGQTFFVQPIKEPMEEK